MCPTVQTHSGTGSAGRLAGRPSVERSEHGLALTHLATSGVDRPLGPEPAYGWFTRTMYACIEIDSLDAAIGLHGSVRSDPTSRGGPTGSEGCLKGLHRPGGRPPRGMEGDHLGRPEPAYEGRVHGSLTDSGPRGR